jgi:hypothetical protein
MDENPFVERSRNLAIANRITYIVFIEFFMIMTAAFRFRFGTMIHTSNWEEEFAGEEVRLS